MSDPNISNIADDPLGPESADGTLVIIVCRAKHLPNRRKLDKQSPYVTLRIGTTAKKTSSHFRAGQTPEWTHEIRFELTRDRRPIMKLDVLDETKNDPTPIGTVDIDCSTVFANPNNEKDGKYIFDKWHDLTLNGRRAGMIYLEMTFYPSAPILPPKFTGPLYNEQDVDAFHHSVSSRKDLPPPPPKHPSQAHPHTVADDIFVTSESEKGSKRMPFFKNSDGSLGGRFSGSNGSGGDDVFEPAKDSNSSPPKKYKLKLMNKFKKFQNKEPITNIWQKGNGQGSPERGTSPISEYRVEDFGEVANEKKKEYYKLPEMPDKFKESDEEDFELRPPIPPPHLVNQQAKSELPPSTPPSSKNQSSNHPSRKPPQDLDDQSHIKPVSNTSIPFSADTIGLDEGEEDGCDGTLPTKVYFLDQQVKSLTFTGREDASKGHQINPDEIDPKYYAPTPNEHFGRAYQPRFSANGEQNGYLGDGKWNRDPKFSPSVFDRMPLIGDENFGFENKPHVPPKIPKGLTEQEYYVLEKEKYLKDVNGRRL
ncbi:DEHA2E09614p [Debaryomyces hansenii CBS767]|uniref:DEHA2E09614p n=1 Tax=Debaryomyces hansenii (strain ATCC 36239 / CBS 767 / BCRC 21394 / JCM 1990 / NBRC 0083 / IGC 2968) TaxID=284592 RepID=B5RTY5_DEBHA|nr:DEHA2E09614p [Debaryomyces hansenii CBS767]CAR65797.1 DEHA2E09614p [Debaryomyces hansenii CBS767]|eukprot:XP_002770454.1 DEHA2E09614p [Debaryomyces hansenii CBS767]